MLILPLGRPKKIFKKVLTTGTLCAIMTTVRGREIETMKDYMEKLGILAYMVENGYCLGERTMDDYCRIFTLEDIRYLCAHFFGEDPTA